jgi:NADPH2:quinone reductase
MKAMLIESFGGVEQLKLADVPIPTPQANEVLIEIAYTSVNPVEWKIREGMLSDILPHQFPIILGWDAAGTISAMGTDVTGFKTGDKVYAYCRKPTVHDGTYAEFITMDAAAVAPMPSGLSFAEAATIPLTGLTAWQALFDFARLQDGDKILIHAGSGGVGSLAIQFAKYRGAKVYTTASLKNHDYVRSLGADAAIDYTAENFVDVTKAAEPDGVDVVFDTLGGTAQEHSFQVLRKGGTLVSIVAPPATQTAEQYQVKAGFVFVSPNGKQLRQIAGLVARGAVRPAHIAAELRLEDAATAQEKSKAHHIRGKIVLKIK